VSIDGRLARLPIQTFRPFLWYNLIYIINSKINYIDILSDYKQIISKIKRREIAKYIIRYKWWRNL
jgi:hypothetical protein